MIVPDWPVIPEKLIKALDFLLRDESQAWLRSAMETAVCLAERWQLQPEIVFDGGAMSLCTLMRDETRGLLVLKVPTDPESGRSESAALRVWNGRGAPRLVATDPASGAFLMSYLAPEVRVVTPEDVVLLCRQLHIDATAEIEFADVSVNTDMRADWASERFAVPEYSLQREQLVTAKLVLADLLRNHTAEPVVLHGDLQDKNLLFSDGSLHTLDPLPVRGPKWFDLAFWVALTSEGLTLRELAGLVADKAQVDDHEFTSWVWCLSVLENRPYQSRGADRRQSFIDSEWHRVGQRK